MAGNSGNLPIQGERAVPYVWAMMDSADPPPPDHEKDSPASDLARRLIRYRRRIEAEGRPRSVRVVDQAIKDADRGSNREA